MGRFAVKKTRKYIPDAVANNEEPPPPLPAVQLTPFQVYLFRQYLSQQQPQREKTALLASVYSGLRTAGRGAVDLGKILAGKGRTGPIDPLFKKELPLTLPEYFKSNARKARRVTKGTLGRAIAAPTEGIARVVGVPAKPRKWLTEAMVDSPTNIGLATPYPDPTSLLSPAHAAYLGISVAGSPMKRALRIPESKHILRDIMDQKAKKIGWKNWDEMLDMQTYDPDSLVANLGKIREEAATAIKRKGQHLLANSSPGPEAALSYYL